MLGKPTKATTFIQRLPFARRHFRSYLPLFPLAIQQLDLSGYDIIISSSHCVAKGVITSPDQLHICYCHSPVRYAWDLQHEYLRESNIQTGLKSLVARATLHRMRIWDVAASNGVDLFVSNSAFIQRRIAKTYRRESQVVYPPVFTEEFTLETQKDDFFLAASRLVPYKRFPLIAKAFAEMPDRKLVIIGEGPDYDEVKRIADQTENINVLGYQPFETLKTYMQSARAFIFAAIEDFGIMPIEAQACGTPVIALNRGGTRESIVGLDQKNPTGVHYEDQTLESLNAAIEKFELNIQKITPQACRAHAEKFSVDRFRQEFQALVSEQYTTHNNSQP